MTALFHALIRLARLRWLGAAFCVLAMLCVSTHASALAGATAHPRVDATTNNANANLTTTASASERAQTKDCVWGLEQNSPLHVWSLRFASAETHLGFSPTLPETASVASYAAEGGGSLSLRFSQTTASPAFSSEGSFAGKTIGGVASELRAGTMAASDVPVGYVNLGGNNLIVNTRSSLALTRAGVPQSQWNLIDMTATDAAHIQSRLLKNGLTNEGTSTLRITGMGKNASSLE